MIKYEQEIIETTQTTATFYCDRCNVFIGKSVEYEDGYIPPHGDYRFHYYLPYTNKTFNVEKTLCKNCRTEIERRLEDAIKEIFVEMGGSE